MEGFSDPATVAGAIVFALVFVLVVAGGRKWVKPARRRARCSPYWERSGPQVASPISDIRPRDPAEQLRAVMAYEYRPKKVISQTEARVMATAEAAITEAGVHWRVLAQVALGEVLACDDEAGFFAINAKRVDLLIMSEARDAIAVIEYQGQGHYQGAAPARDAIKKEALRKAGIKYIEITHEHGPDDVRREISRLAWSRDKDGRSRSVEKFVPRSQASG